MAVQVGEVPSTACYNPVAFDCVRRELKLGCFRVAAVAEAADFQRYTPARYKVGDAFGPGRGQSSVTLIVPGGAIDTGTKTFAKDRVAAGGVLIDPGYAEVHFNLAALAGRVTR
jgi:hypothetical protein